ncbi:unnamed protein product [Clonostachys rhizophaga]|uniref:Uncharacterized protein n=1 Tax=Clonostachys rhizophaga TaxID=160324 RepID=A0A9N9VGS6_9HYPO|nr:unnamed protein product [Clonostachys rhizophaga]
MPPFQGRRMSTVSRTSQTQGADKTEPYAMRVQGTAGYWVPEGYLEISYICVSYRIPRTAA